MCDSAYLVIIERNERMLQTVDNLRYINRTPVGIHSFVAEGQTRLSHDAFIIHLECIKYDLLKRLNIHFTVSFNLYCSGYLEHLERQRHFM